MIRYGLAAAALLSLGACMTDMAPLAINQAPVDMAKSATEVETAILASLQARGWTVKEKTPGRILATVSVRDRHSATIAVTYTDKAYSIAYVDSTGLDYDATKGTIHRNYNRWVANLDKDIAAKT